MIRIPFTSLHAPWVLLFSVAMALVLAVACAGACGTRRLITRPPALLLGALFAAVVLAKAARRAAPAAVGTLRAWRGRHCIRHVIRARWETSRSLRQWNALHAYDGPDYWGHGIPRADWRPFLHELADLEWRMCMRERGGQQ